MCICVCVCVFIQNPHIHKFLAVFLYGFSRTGSAAISVIGLRRPPSAVCAEGCVAGMCPYCFILLYNIWCSFYLFQAAHGLRTRAKISTKRFPAKDFGAFVVPFFHACCPIYSRRFASRLLSTGCETVIFLLFLYVFPEFLRFHAEFLYEEGVESRLRQAASHTLLQINSVSTKQSSRR